MPNGAEEVLEGDELLDDYEADSEEEEATEEGAAVFLIKLANPLHLCLFGIALVVDAVEVVLDLIGLFTSASGVGAAAMAVIAFFFDLVAFLTIGLWLFFKASSAVASGKLAERVKGKLKGAITGEVKKEAVKGATKAARWGSRHLNWIRVFVPLFELIPYVSAVPGWTLAVWAEIKNSD